VKKTILIIGTLDTKGDEFAYVKKLIEDRGLATLVLDAGVLGEPGFKADIGAAEVAKAGGSTLEVLRSGGRGPALEAVSAGARAVALALLAENKFDAVLSLGGSGGTAIATTAMLALPVGMPKVMVSTMASGNVSSYVGVKDITMMYSVVDVAGLNRLSRRIMANAAGAVCGMVEQAIPAGVEKPLIAATMFGVTTPCVDAVRHQLEGSGYEVLVFHATGSGGKAMEALVDGGFLAGVADVTTTEWCDELVGGVLTAGPHRLEAAARKGLPQVVSLGALDMVNFGPVDTVPEQFKGRIFYKHNSSVTLMRTTPAENAELGRIIAEKLNKTTGPTALFVPLKGVSMLDAEGQAFWSPDADAALFMALRKHVDKKKVDLVELDLHVNDPAFSKALADRLLMELKKAKV